MEITVSFVAVLQQSSRPVPGEWEASGGDRYRLTATLGEVEINLGNWTEAEEWYRRVAGVGQQRPVHTDGDALDAPQPEGVTHALMVAHLGRL